MVKSVGVIIEFDDVDYSDEERDLLWGRFALMLVEAAELKKKKEITNDKRVKTTNRKTYRIPA